MTPWAPADDGVRLSVRVKPKGGRDVIEGLSIDAHGRPHLAIRVAAAPEDGAANEAVRRVVADTLGRRIRDIDIVAGRRNRYKQLRILGPSDDIIGQLDAATRKQE